MEEFYKIKMNSRELFEQQKGFTMIELLIVMVLLAILAGTAVYSFKKTKEGIACSDVFSAFQMAKMRAISTGYNAYVDFDMSSGAVSDGFYTVYLDTDGDTAFGEINNANGHNEFTEANFAMPDSSGGFPGMALPDGVRFGGNTASGGTMGTNGPTGGTIPDDGVSATSDRFKFSSKGTASVAGSVYLWDSNDSRGAGCAVIVSPTGIIRKWNWDGSNWN